MRPSYFALVLLLIIALGPSLFSPAQDEPEMPGGITDWSNTDAPKTIESKDIKTFRTSFVYAEEAGAYGRYDFGAEKQADGTVELTWFSYDEDLKLEVGPEFLLKLQEIIDKHNLAGCNGTNRVTSGLPYQYEPCHLHCQYESGEKINFYMDGEPYSEWMGDFTDLFLSVFLSPDGGVDLPLGSDICRFYYQHSGMARPDIYSFEVEKKGDNYTLKVNFFDPENSYEPVELIWDNDEYKDIVKYVYNRAVEIYEIYEISSWDGFDETDHSVRDGSMFSISIDFENGANISAYGNNVFPLSFPMAEEDFKYLMDNIMAFYSKLQEAN